MEQSTPPAMPVMDSGKQSNGKGLKITVILTSLAAVWGIGLGIYGMIQSAQKDSQISNLNVQKKDSSGKITTLETEKIETTDKNGTTVTISDTASTISGLHTVGDTSTKRKYYIGVTDLDPGKDTREKDTYIIDITQLGSKDGVKKYDLKTVLDKAVSTKVASLPNTLAAGTVNATPKSSCQSYKVNVGDPAYIPGARTDWTVATDWSNLVPLTIHMSCIANSGNKELSLGTGLYSLNPSTNELVKLIDIVY